MKTPALVAALVVALALGSTTGYAAGKLPKNSVGSAQLKKSAVKTVDIKNGAVTATKIHADSITGTQVDESTLAPRPGTLVLSGLDFVPQDSASTYQSAGLGDVISTSAGTFTASVHLPAGTQPTAVRVYLGDANVSQDASVVFREQIADAATAGQASAVAKTAGVSTSVQTVRLTPVPVPAGSVGLIVVDLPANFFLIMGAQVDYR